jgi:hypothetical protein
VLKSLSLAFALALTVDIAHASPPAAWEEFRREVEQKCLEAAKSIESARVMVDPFGSESYGLAIVTGKAKGGKAPISQICVMNKRTKAIEIGGELSLEQVKVGK